MTTLLELVCVKDEDLFIVKSTKPTFQQAEKITEWMTRDSGRKGFNCCLTGLPFCSDGANVWTPPHALEHLLLESDQDGFTDHLETEIPDGTTQEAHFTIEIWHRKEPLSQEEIITAIGKINSL